MITIAKLQVVHQEIDVVGRKYPEYKKNLHALMNKFSAIEIGTDQFTASVLSDKELNSVYTIETKPDRLIISRKAVL